MPLVDYTDSDSSGDEGDAVESKIPSGDAVKDITDGRSVGLPPLPPGFHDLYGSQVRTSTQDDPSLHGGRSRQTPHVEGIPQPTDLVQLEAILAQVDSLRGESSWNKQIHSFVKSDLGVPLPLHISLSSPITLATDELESFLHHLQTLILGAAVQPFTAKSSNLDWASNHDHSRHFLVLRLDQSNKDSMNKLLKAVNETSRSFGKSTLYDAASDKGQTGPASASDLAKHCHISIAWCLELPQLDQNHLLGLKPGPFAFSVAEIKAKLGNRIHSIGFTGD